MSWESVEELGQNDAEGSVANKVVHKVVVKPVSQDDKCSGRRVVSLTMYRWGLWLYVPDSDNASRLLVILQGPVEAGHQQLAQIRRIQKVSVGQKEVCHKSVV